MTNKERLTKNNENLSLNNGSLGEVLDYVNNLPDRATLQDKSIEITENGTINLNADEGFDGLGNVEITTNVEGGSTPSVKEKDVNFYDYDGTLLYSYTIDEIMDLDTLPDGPAHPGLVFEDWNWTLDDIKEENDRVIVGAQYLTDDESTRFYIKLINRLDIRLGIGISGSANVDWGDGSNTDIVGTTIYQNTYAEHEYLEPGNYIISIKSNSDILINNNRSTPSVGELITSTTRHDSGSLETTLASYRGVLKRVDLGKARMNNYAFRDYYNLETVTANSYTTLNGNGFGGDFLFEKCYNLKAMVVPRGTKALAGSCFNSTGIRMISLPNTITYMGMYALQGMDVKRIYFSKKLPTLGQNILGSNNQIEELEILFNNFSASPGTNAFGRMKGLKRATIKNINIVGYLFQEDYNLEEVIVKGNITSVDENAFKSNIGLALLDLRECTSIPTLKNINAFSGISEDCCIVVPDELGDEWKATGLWSDPSIAPHIVKASMYKQPYLELNLINPIKVVSENSKTIQIPFGGSCTGIKQQTLELTVSCSNSELYDITSRIDYSKKTCVIDVQNLIPLGEDDDEITSTLTVTLKDNEDNLSDTKIGEITLIHPLPVYYEVVDVEGAEYNFELNSDDYYESTNKGHDNTAALCQINFSTGTGKLILDYIQNAESTYDFSLFSNIDTRLSTSATDTTTGILKNLSGDQSPDVRTYEYNIPDSGDHFIQIKYKKDGSVASGYDSIQFKVRFE